MKTIKEIEKGCETCRNNYKFHKNRGDLNMWKLCLTCQSLLNYSNEIIEEIDKWAKHCGFACDYQNVQELKQSIIGETK